MLEYDKKSAGKNHILSTSKQHEILWEGKYMTLAKAVSMKYNKTIEKCSNEEIYYALLDMTKQMAEDKVSNEGKKKLYYISAEFLIGKLLSNNLINLGIYDSVKSELEASGKNIGEIEEIELEPSLGNGGLGRLAACFVDSIATLGLNGDGVGLNYHYGLFKQVFDHNLQKETPNPWITPDSWLTKTDITYPVQFGGFTVQSRLYNIDVVGYNNRTTKLRLFDIETVDESIVGDTIDFNKDDIAKNLTLFLYPDDSDDKGRLLRVYQQYFMVSNAARLILDEAVEKGSNLHDLADYATVQINDTHPSMVIPELIRLLQERGILMDEAVSIVSKVCAYTNHTILAEALEKWPIGFLEKAVPQLMPIIRELDNRVRAKVSDESTYIIKDGLVHMAHMDIHYGYSVNGVAYLHTEILKNSELNNFYKLYPEKFNNKTNGITFRRWLMSCNPELSAMITDLIGDGWKKDANELEKLGNFVNDDAVLDRLLAVKAGKKADLKNYLKMKQGFDIDENVIKIARSNAANAGVEDLIHFQARSVSELSHHKKYGFIITNPPYGERLEDKETLPAIYSAFGKQFAKLVSWSAYMITSYEDAVKYFGRKADKNRKIYNGMLKTYFYSFMGPKPPKRG